MTPRLLVALVVADVRERARRPVYAVVLLAAVALGYLAVPAPDSNWQIFQIGDYRGVYTSAYVGTVTALAGAVWLSLAGFYVVKNAIVRDERTGVGQILATTPLGRAPYLFGKFLSNLAVLASMTGALALTAAGMQLWRGEDRDVHPIALLGPFLLITVPVLAVTAGAAVLFETVPGLRSGPGNIIWIPLWIMGSVALQSGDGFDALGLKLVTDSMHADIARTLGDTRVAEFGVGLVERTTPLTPFPWSGADLGGAFALQRLILLGTAAILLGRAFGSWAGVRSLDPPTRRIAWRAVVHGIWDETDTLLGWDDTVDWAERLELPVVPVLYRGVGISSARTAWARLRDPARSEGFVVRSAGRIPAAEYPFAVLQWVRPLPDLAAVDPAAVNEFA